MKNISIIAVVIILAGSGYYAVTQNNSENSNQAEVISETSIVSDENNNETSSTETDSQDEINNNQTAGQNETKESAGIYTEYSSEKLAMHEGKDIVLFFKADWCPSCRGLDKDIKENMSQIPANIVILDVDYDEYTDLRQKYGVTTQHTLVQVSSNGDLIMKWSGGSTLESIINKIN
jgi:thioredoxin 1